MRGHLDERGLRERVKAEPVGDDPPGRLDPGELAHVAIKLRDGAHGARKMIHRAGPVEVHNPHDRRGHGRSGISPGPYNMERLGRDALAIMDALSLARVHWCGLSMGGMVGQWLGANAPQRLDRLILSNTSSYYADKGPWNERIAVVSEKGLAAVADRVPVPELWTHQAAAIDLARDGTSVAVATGTASGKSLCYQLPIAEAVAEADTPGSALLIYPTKALAQDQLRALAGCDYPGLLPATYDGDAGPEQRTWVRRHANVVHDPASYGCVACHGGQGRATDIADAHGAVPHWPELMLDKKYLYAGCGGCHTHLSVPNFALLERGKVAFEQADCLSCHKLDGRGGTFRPGGVGAQEGSDLSRAGATGYKANWYEHHLEQKKKAAPGAWISAFGELPEAARLELDEYLRSRVGAPGLVEAKALFHSLGCRGCHKVRGVGGDDGPDLTAEGNKDPGQLNFAQIPGERTLVNWLKQHFRAPAAVVHGSAMPELGLTEPQILQLVRGPQAFRFALAPMTNDFVALLKDSSLVSVITVVELTKQTSIFAANIGSWVIPGAMCAGLYPLLSHLKAKLEDS